MEDQRARQRRRRGAGITAHRLKALGLVDKIVNEPVGGAHRDHQAMATSLKRALADAWRQLADLKTDELLERRTNASTATAASPTPRPMPRRATAAADNPAWPGPRASLAARHPLPAHAPAHRVLGRRLRRRR